MQGAQSDSTLELECSNLHSAKLRPRESRRFQGLRRFSPILVLKAGRDRDAIPLTLNTALHTRSLDFAAIHPDRSAGKPTSFLRNQVCHQTGNVLRVTLAGDAGLFRKLLHSFFHLFTAVQYAIPFLENKHLSRGIEGWKPSGNYAMVTLRTNRFLLAARYVTFTLVPHRCLLAQTTARAKN